VFSRPDRGAVLIGDVLLGAMLVLILAATAGAAGRIVATGESAREASRGAAVAIARGWDPEAALRHAALLAPDTYITSHQVDGAVVVTVEAVTELPHPVLGRLPLSLSVSTAVPIAPYRSRRDG
jgi:hypothetical protein